MKTKFSVTQEHIDSGEPANASVCPIALAIREKLNLNSVKVFPSSVRLDSHPSYPLPRSAQRFIVRFDQGYPVKPFNFVLEIRKK